MFWPEVLKQNLGFKLGYRTNKFPDDEGTPLYFITCTLQITTKDLLLAILGNDIAQDRPWGLSRDATLLEQREGEFDGGVLRILVSLSTSIQYNDMQQTLKIKFWYDELFFKVNSLEEGVVECRRYNVDRVVTPRKNLTFPSAPIVEEPRKRRRTTIPEQPIRKEEIDSEALVFHEEVDEFDDYLETNKSEKNESFSHNEGKRQ
eukprot:TRINITY_DN469_c0_g1_i5.p2 TRINITY_DN469_c0_g1~~TRINITY_DN469_c0_g1_i5.p2  ORF type:complete len:204 (-),score=40.59 TRINITY_DN469_c0_g1_i5:968-1579(-)